MAHLLRIRTRTGLGLILLALAVAVPMKTDDLAHEARWKEKKVSDLPPGRYLLRVHLEKADLFAVTLK